MTLAAAVADARRRLLGAGIPADEAAFDARLLAQVVLGWDAARYLTAANQAPPPGFSSAYESVVSRRAAREPVAYITGRREFWGLPFLVTPAVLIPRPETEIIVAASLELFPEAQAPIDLADVCTGGGCIAVALAHDRPAARVIATDISPDALSVAAQNARMHGVAERIRFTATNLLAGISGPFDLIVSNPPYVPAADRAALPPEVRDYEPAVALFGGGDGLAEVRRLVSEASDCLKPGGFLLFEFGLGQAERVTDVIAATRGLVLVELRPDLQGIPRTAIVQSTR